MSRPGMRAISGIGRKRSGSTPTSADERYAAGAYPPPRNQGQGLPAYTAGDRSTTDTDVTLWHSFGLTHDVRVEDYPVMPVEYARCTWVPFGFFDRNPALDLPASEHCEPA